MSGQTSSHAVRRLAVGAAAIVAVALGATGGAASAATHPAPLGGAKAWKMTELAVPGSDEFGFEVALSGNGEVAVASSVADNAYVFTRAGNEWSQAAELTSSDGTSGDGFGATVAVSRDGSTILIGAPHHDDYTGAAYVFTRSGGGWTQTAELTASDPVESGAFGWSVSMSADGSTALVGAVGQGIGGQAYLFDRLDGTWTQTALLSPADVGVGDAFGERVALTADGSTAVIGSVFHGGEYPGAGAAYVFGNRGRGWKQTAELAPSDGAREDEFGSSVAVSRTGAVIVVGASVHHKAFGAAYVFTRSRRSYTQSDELTASDGTGNDFFGNSVAVSDNGSLIAVGAPLHHYQAGAEYIYTRKAGAWSQRAELASTRRRERNWFGYSTGLSCDGSTLLIGAFTRGSGAGSAFVFTR